MYLIHLSSCFGPDEPADVRSEPERCPHGVRSARDHNGRLGGTSCWSDPQYSALEVSEEASRRGSSGVGSAGPIQGDGSIFPFVFSFLDQRPEHTERFMYCSSSSSSSPTRLALFPTLLLCYWGAFARSANSYHPSAPRV